MLCALIISASLQVIASSSSARTPGEIWREMLETLPGIQSRFPPTSHMRVTHACHTHTHSQTDTCVRTCSTHTLARGTRTWVRPI